VQLLLSLSASYAAGQYNSAVMILKLFNNIISIAGFQGIERHGIIIMTSE
jgi:hypothetical protein